MAWNELVTTVAVIKTLGGTIIAVVVIKVLRISMKFFFKTES